MLTCFLNLRVVPYRPANGLRRGSNCDARQKGAWVQRRGFAISQARNGAVSKRRRQRLVDGRLKFENRWSSFARLLRIERFKACDALLQTLDASPLLSDCENRSSR